MTAVLVSKLFIYSLSLVEFILEERMFIIMKFKNSVFFLIHVSFISFKFKGG